MSKRTIALFTFVLFLLTNLFLASYLTNRNEKTIIGNKTGSIEEPTTTQFSSSGDIKITYPNDYYETALKMELYEQPSPAKIDGYVSVRVFSLFAFDLEKQPVWDLSKEITIEYDVPENITIGSRDLNVNDKYTYRIDIPSVFLYEKDSGWKKIEAKWDRDNRKLYINTKRIGSFAVVISDNSVKTVTN